MRHAHPTLAAVYSIRPGSSNCGGGRVFGVLLRAWAVIEMRQDALDHFRIAI